MKTKAKKFSRKLLALLMAVIMGLTCFTGAISSFAASSDTEYTDDALEYNTLGWPMLSDEQVATALLDYADSVLPALKELETTLAAQVGDMSIAGGIVRVNWDLNSRRIIVRIMGIEAGSITVKLGSVDELLETINSVQSLLTGGLVSTAQNLGVDLGDIPSIDLSAFNGMRRNNTSSCDILRAVFKLVYDNREPIIGKFLRGNLTLGVVDGSFNVYDTIGNLVGAPSGYQSNMVYNIVKSLLLNNTGWFTADEIAAYNDGTKEFVLDEVLLDKLTTVVVQKMASVLVTYPDGTNSQSRYSEIKAYMTANGVNYAAAARALGYDPDVVYSDEFVSDDGGYANVLLFAYGSPDDNGLPTANTEMLSISKTDSLLQVGFNALKIAWNSVLQETLNTLHVNNYVERGYGSNFDNEFYYWQRESANGGWDYDNAAANYTAAKVESWAAAVYESYNAESAEEFLGWVKDNYVFDRAVAEDAEGTWADIESQTLFNKLRYSPLADYYFDMQTGPLNLYLSQTGTSNLDEFFSSSYSSYSSLTAMLNDALVAVVRDLFPTGSGNGKNIDADHPELATTGSADTQTVVDALVDNAMKVLQYTADATDKNILNGFYKGGGTVLDTSNLEEAMIPLLISCIGNVWFNSNGSLADLIHPSDWDKCRDAESVAFVTLREYLSYVQAQKDYDDLAPVKTDEKGEYYDATLEGTIYPMARDAIAYVIDASVPITDKNGASWSVENSTTGDGMDIFEVLNSVVCYYAGRYEVSTGYTNGVGNMLGAVDASGNDSINRSNSLWKNIDVIVNKFFPVMATFQGTDEFDSEQFILKDIILGILDIGDTSLHGGTDGIRSFLLKLLNGINEAPVAQTPVHLSIYNVLKDLLNGIFGARYTGQSYTTIIPDASSDSPFDDLLQVGVIATENTGVVQKVLCNVPEFAGCVNYPDSLLPGLTYAVTAVNSIFGFIPLIGNSSFEPVTAEAADPSMTSMGSGTSRNTSISITNNSLGVNNAYRDGVTGEVVQLDRYYINVKSIKVNDGDASVNGVNFTGATSGRLAPGETLTVPMSVTNQQSSSNTNKYTFVYDITDKSGNLMSDEYQDLEASVYQFIDPIGSWQEAVYPDDRIENGIRRFPESLETNNSNSSVTSGSYTNYTTQAFGTRSRLNVLYPEYMVVTSDNLSAVDDYGYRIRNVSSVIGGGSAEIEGMYTYDEKTVYDDLTSSNVTVGADNAIPVFDKNTGDLLKHGKFDVKYAGSETWDDNNGSGYTEAEVSAIEQAIESTRTHIAYTLQEAIDAGIIRAYHYNSDKGIYEYVYLRDKGTSDQVNRYWNLLTNVSMRGPVDGFILNSQLVENISRNSSRYSLFMYYDGETVVEPGEYSAKIRCYSTQGSADIDKMTFVVMNTESKASLGENYQDTLDVVARYQTKDFADESTLSYVQTALQEALSVYGRPTSPISYKELLDTTSLQAVTTQVTTQYGEAAYVPYTTANDSTMPNVIKAEATIGDDNVYYYDAACTLPIYSNVPLSAADVTDGKDAAGVEVIADSTGAYFIKNAPVYATEWDTTTYTSPWRRPTAEQATDGSGNLLYEQIQFAHYDASSQSTTAADWAASYAVTEYSCIDNTGEAGSTDYRGEYTQQSDTLAYVLYYVDLNALNFGNQLLSEISEVRSGLNQNNFEIQSYNQTVNTAKRAEANYTIDVTYAVDEGGQKVTKSVTGLSFSQFNSDYKQYEDSSYKYASDTVVTANTDLTSMQVDEYIRQYTLYSSKMEERGYIGNKLEAEIVCASGNSYDKLNATPATYNEDGTIATPASVSNNGGSDPKFGSFDASGNLVNLENGAKAYSDASWTAYITALANAVELAQFGNGDYAHKSAGYYDMTAKDSYTAQLSKVYDTDSALQVAEIALTPAESVLVTVAEVEGAEVTVNGVAYTAPMSFEIGTTVTVEVKAADGYTYDHMLVNGTKVIENPYTVTLKAGDADITVQPVVKQSGVTVSGKVVIATNLDGTQAGPGIIGIDVMVNGEVVATSAADGSFTATVPAGTTELTFAGPTTIDRTVTISGNADVKDATVPIVVCDYSGDGSIDAIDKLVFANAFTGLEENVYCDLNGDGQVDAIDKLVFSAFFMQKVNYNSLTLS